MISVNGNILTFRFHYVLQAQRDLYRTNYITLTAAMVELIQLGPNNAPFPLPNALRRAAMEQYISFVRQSARALGALVGVPSNSAYNVDLAQDINIVFLHWTAGYEATACTFRFFGAWCCAFDINHECSKTNYVRNLNMLLRGIRKRRIGINIFTNTTTFPTCPVCLEQFEFNETVLEPCVSHVMHEQCLRAHTWRNNSCALCRKGFSISIMTDPHLFDIGAAGGTPEVLWQVPADT